LSLPIYVVVKADFFHVYPARQKVQGFFKKNGADPENRDNDEISGGARFLKSKPGGVFTVPLTSGNRRDPSFSSRPLKVTERRRILRILLQLRVG
jgi:hypothetical protein